MARVRIRISRNISSVHLIIMVNNAYCVYVRFRDRVRPKKMNWPVPDGSDVPGDKPNSQNSAT